MRDGTKNLNPVRTKDEAKKRGKAGGVASGKARREKRDLRKCLEILLEKEMKSRSGEKMSGAEAISAKLFENALKGDIKAFEVVRDTTGQKPIERIVTAELDQSVLDDIENTITEINKERE